MWEIEFYKHSNGRIPFKEFVNGLNKADDIAYIQNALKQLAEHGYKLDFPHVNFLKDDIYELRVHTRNGQFRCLYFFYDGSKIVVTHGFQKKTRKVPAGEKERAMEYRRNYLAQHQGKK